MNKSIKEFPVKGDNRIIVSDGIMLKGEPVCAGCKMLQGLKALFSSTAAESVTRSEYAIGAIADMPEFGLYDMIRSTDGLSESLKFFQNNDAYQFYLYNDYNGVMKFLSAKNGMIFLHPSFGRVSRYGLVSSVSSMDQIGIAGKNLQKVFALLEVLSGQDGKDIAALSEKFKINEKVPAPKEYTVDDISTFPYFNELSAVFFILAATELSNNISKYDGIKYGYRTKNYNCLEELYCNSRGEGFGLYTKFAAIAGTALLSRNYYTDYYEKSLRIRRAIKNGIEGLLQKHSIVVFPFDLNQAMNFDTAGLFALPALTGLPALSMRHKDRGLLAIAAKGAENDLLAYARVLEA